MFYRKLLAGETYYKRRIIWWEKQVGLVFGYLIRHVNPEAASLVGEGTRQDLIR